MKTKIFNKGYTLKVRSWENDGDYPQTLEKTVDTIEEAEMWSDLVNLCHSSSKKGLGNSYDGFTTKQKRVAVDFIKENIELLNKSGYTINSDEDDLSDCFQELASELLGSSEYYACRVMENCDVLYSDIDIYVDYIIV